MKFDTISLRFGSPWGGSYRLTVANDGGVAYLGPIKPKDVESRVTWIISPDAVAFLESVLDQSGFLGLPESLVAPVEISDTPGSTITVVRPDQSVKAVRYTPFDNAMPLSMKLMESAILKAARIDEHIKEKVW